MTCCTLTVASKLTCGNSACSARTSLSAWVGPLKKSGSPNEMCCAPLATWPRMSAITTGTGTMRNFPWYTGTTGQWRHRCLQPRLPSANPAPFEVAGRFAPGRGAGIAPQALGEAQQRGLELPAEDRSHAQLLEQCRVHRRIQTVDAQGSR